LRDQGRRNGGGVAAIVRCGGTLKTVDLLSGHKSWRMLLPHEAVVLLSELRAPWWVAGGWALDLFLGRVSRAHKDLDIGIFRSDSVDVIATLPGWEFFESKDGVLSMLAPGAAPRAGVNSLWCKPANAAQWELELMLDGSDVESWIFRRDSRLTRPLSSAIRRNPEGIAYLAPEIQLLYKARATRTEDQADFDHVVPHLERDSRNWLRESLMTIDPDHAWISMLEDYPESTNAGNRT
jgi:Aminoglycoside-2''-adenylyltransferase